MAVGERLTLRQAMDTGWQWRWTPTGNVAHAVQDNGTALCGIENATESPPLEWGFESCATCSERIIYHTGNKYVGEEW